MHKSSTLVRASKKDGSILHESEYSLAADSPRTLIRVRPDFDFMDDIAHLRKVYLVNEFLERQDIHCCHISRPCGQLVLPLQVIQNLKRKFLEHWDRITRGNVNSLISNMNSHCVKTA
ncbi:hypothetical protein TNCV_2785571 [Trichonephila clavipes]|nr:hypothetical protein TNCV_2785571 [Trichonephila clavipes]